MNEWRNSLFPFLIKSKIEEDGKDRSPSYSIRLGIRQTDQWVQIFFFSSFFLFFVDDQYNFIVSKDRSVFHLFLLALELNIHSFIHSPSSPLWFFISFSYVLLFFLCYSFILFVILFVNGFLMVRCSMWCVSVEERIDVKRMSRKAPFGQRQLWKTKNRPNQKKLDPKKKKNRPDDEWEWKQSSGTSCWWSY